VAAQLAPHNDFVVMTVRTADYNSRVALASSYTSADAFDNDPITLESIYTARLTESGGVADVRLIDSANLSEPGDQPRLALLPGGLLLAFVNQAQELHVAFYEGSKDSVVAKNVTGVWSVGSARAATAGH
jgi:hypothetical protein